MSSEQSLDPQLIEQTRQQIRSLVGEIAHLSKEEIAPEEFYGQFLTRVVSALAAIGGAVWTTNEEGRLALQHQINLQQANLRDDEQAQAQHGRLLYKALSADEGMLVPPHSGSGEDDQQQAANPTDFLLVLGPLKTDLEVVGVLEVFQRSEAGPGTQKGYLRFLMQMCELAGDFLKSHQLRHFSDRQVLWTQLEDFTHQVHTSLDPREAAYTIANEGRRLIECDRVSVAIRKGNKCRIEAVSGQDVFDKRSNTVRLLGRLATVVVKTGDPVWYTGDTSEMAPQVEDAVQEYVDESHSKNVAVLPLKRPELDEEDDPDKREEPEPPVGALIVEQIEDSRVPRSMLQRVDVVCRHSSTALANALEHQNLFLMPLWRLLGKTRWVLRARTLPKTLTIVGIVLALILALVFVPADFEVRAKGTLEPVVRAKVYVGGWPGRVTKLYVEDGDPVKEGDPLAEITSGESDVQFAGAAGELEAIVKEINGLLSDRDKTGLSSHERRQLEWKLAELREIRATRADVLKLLEDRRAKELLVKSPIAGEVITWKLRERLLRRWVQPGNRLLEIAQTDGQWQLEILMPDDRMGHVQTAENRLAEGQQLKVTFILATDPGIKHQGTVKEIGPRTDVRGDEGNTVLIKVDFNKKELLAALSAGPEDQTRRLSPGSEVTAKIYCGRRAIGYVWLHDLLAFIQSRILFRFF